MAGSSSSDQIIVPYVPMKSNEHICKVLKERSNVSLGKDSTFPSTVTFSFCVSLFRFTQLTRPDHNYESHMCRLGILPILFSLRWRN